MADDILTTPKIKERFAIAMDEWGYPMMFDVAHAEPVVEEPPKPEPPTLPAAPPGGVEPVEWSRRHDRIRDIAREFDGASEADVREYLTGLTKRDLTDDEVALVHLEVTNQRIGDLVDILDEQLRSKVEGMKRGRRRVRVQAPRGFTKKALNNLTDEQAAEVLHRLEIRGHSREAIDALLARRFREGRHEAIVSAREKIELGFSTSDLTQGRPITWTEAQALSEDPLSPGDFMTFAASVFETVATKMPAPMVSIEVPVTVEQKGGKKVVKRDPQTGLISSVEEEE